MLSLHEATTASARRPFESYLTEINRTPLLRRDEERDLAVRVLAGDSEARDHLVRANLRLVVGIARGYAGRGLPPEDLIAEGNMGLLRAAEGFDPAMGNRFSTYASYWIKQSIKRAVVNTAQTVRVPAYMVERLSKWRRATNKLTDELGRTPTHEEVARFLGLPKKKLNVVRRAIQVSKPAPRTDQGGDGGWSIEEMLPDGRSNSPDTQMVKTDDLKRMMRLLDKMDDREATVLRMRFGLGDREPMTLLRIGQTFHLTRERVRQIENEALAKLRDQWAD